MTRIDKEEQSAAALAHELARLRQIEAGLADKGRKLSDRDRLRAAFHLTRAWNDANRTGLRREDFEEMVFERLHHRRRNSTGFTLKNWRLKRGEDPFKTDLTVVYAGSSTPQKDLGVYLTVIEVAAEVADADPDRMKLDMLRELNIWARPSGKQGVIPPDDRPAETLAILLNALCDHLATRNRLGETFRAIEQMNCVYDLFEERLTAYDGHAPAMEKGYSPLSIDFGDGDFVEEMFPFPSVPLLEVPYLVGHTTFVLAPKAALTALRTGQADLGTTQPFPEDLPGLIRQEGRLIWSRELHLAIVIDGKGGFAPAIQTRPRLEISFPDDSPVAGRHHVLWATRPYVQDSFCVLGGIEKHDQPLLADAEGRSWAVQIDLPPFDERVPVGFVVRNLDTTGWGFEEDPITMSGEKCLGDDYISYTPATAPYLRHWLTRDWRLGDTALGWEHAKCPWAPTEFELLNADSDWKRNVPSYHTLNFAELSDATWVEAGLHSGRIEEALQASISRLVEQTAELQAKWHHDRERNNNLLLKRWKDASTDQGD